MSTAFPQLPPDFPRGLTLEAQTVSAV